MQDRDSLQRAIETAVAHSRDALIADTSRILQFESISGATDPADRARHDAATTQCAAFLRDTATRMGFRWIEKPARWYCIEWPAARHPSTSSTPLPRRLVRRSLGEVGSPPGEVGSTSSTQSIPSIRVHSSPFVAPTPSKVIAIPVHIDVVPAGGVWAFPPFSGAIAHDAVWGRGAVDMKGPLIACLHALHALKQAGFVPPVTYRIVIGALEEINDWSDIDEYLAEQGAPDFGFTPDACFPVVIGEKGTLTFRAAAHWPSAPVPSPSLSSSPSTPPTESVESVGSIPSVPCVPSVPVFPSPPQPHLALHTLSGGTRGNVVPDLCEITLRFPRAQRYEFRTLLYNTIGMFETGDCEGSIEYAPESAAEAPDARLDLALVFRGKSAHGSTPEKGHNAILDALRFLDSLPLADTPPREFARFLLHAAADRFGAGLNLTSNHDFIGPTTVNLGVARIDPHHGEATFNARPTLGLSVAETERRIESAARAFSPAVLPNWEFQRIQTAYEPQYLDPDRAAPFLRGLSEGFEAATGLPARHASIPYTTYAKAMPNCCAFGPILHAAGEEDMAHQPDERVSIDALQRNTRIFALALAFAALNVADSQ